MPIFYFQFFLSSKEAPSLIPIFRPVPLPPNKMRRERISIHIFRCILHSVRPERLKLISELIAIVGPWYLTTEESNKPGLKHQRATDNTSQFDRTWYPRGAMVCIKICGPFSPNADCLLRFKTRQNTERVHARTVAP